MESWSKPSSKGVFPKIQKIALLVNGREVWIVFPASFADFTKAGSELIVDIGDRLAVANGGTVGFGGQFYDPAFVGAKRAEDAIAAFNWLAGRIPSLSGWPDLPRHGASREASCRDGGSSGPLGFSKPRRYSIP